MKLSNPLFTLDHERLKKDLAFIRGEKFSRFIRRRTVFYMDGYRYAYAAAKKRWNIDFAFFEAGHEIVKPVYLSGSLNEKAAEIWWRKMHENPQFTRQLIRELEILIKSTSDWRGLFRGESSRQRKLNELSGPIFRGGLRSLSLPIFGSR